MRMNTFPESKFQNKLILFQSCVIKEYTTYDLSNKLFEEQF